MFVSPSNLLAVGREESLRIINETFHFAQSYSIVAKSNTGKAKLSYCHPPPSLICPLTKKLN